jgi:sugar phosphate isomerase/epimerase
MTETPRIILSGFADEAAHTQTAVEQFAVFAALGLQYYSLRNIDVGEGKKNVMDLTIPEITRLRHLEDEYDLSVSCIGSPIGKVKLVDVEDGTTNRYVPFKKYLEKDVKKACELAHAFETKLIRGFSFYPPKGADPREHLAQAVEQIGQIADTCLRSDLTFGLEVEANLVGQNGEMMAEIYRQVDNAAMVLIFDAANIICQGYSTHDVFDQYLAMKSGLGWIHIKDYRVPSGTNGHARATRQPGHVDEGSLKHFVPVDVGDCAYDAILKDFRSMLPKLEAKLKRRGIPGVFLDLEPHVKAGGQFSGSSGPDGMGVALRGLCKVLDYVGIDYHLRDFDDIVATRGF